MKAELRIAVLSWRSPCQPVTRKTTRLTGPRWTAAAAPAPAACIPSAAPSASPMPGTMSGGNYSLDGGFWGIIAAVQTPGAPWLTITLNSQLSTITVSWPLSETSWQLQATTNLVTGGSVWSTCS